MILGVFSQLGGSGGIQGAGRQAGAALASFAAEIGVRCRILSLKDTEGFQSIRSGGIEFTFQGFGGNKARLAMKALSVASRTGVTYLGHVGFAPLGLALRFRRKPKYIIASHGVEAWDRLRPLSLSWAQKSGMCNSAKSVYGK